MDDRVLGLSILGASPAADIIGGRRTSRPSPRRSADEATRQRDDKEEQERRRRRQREAESRHFPRFAPEFDGIDCFETIVSH